MAAKNFKVGDRVVRSLLPGSKGYVKELREEASVVGDTRDKESLMIVGVQWDNGTLSFFGPGGLEHTKE